MKDVVCIESATFNIVQDQFLDGLKSELFFAHRKKAKKAVYPTIPP